MSNGHTPGPWVVVTELRDTDEIICDMLNNGYVAITQGQKLANWRDDAALIAEAPNLLAGLKKMLDNEEQRIFEKWLLKKTPSGDVSSVQGQWLDSSEYEDFLETWSFQIAAIAKARGEPC